MCFRKKCFCICCKEYYLDDLPENAIITKCKKVNFCTIIDNVPFGFGRCSYCYHMCPENQCLYSQPHLMRG